jgi:hypothetical protein
VPQSAKSGLKSRPFGRRSDQTSKGKRLRQDLVTQFQIKGMGIGQYQMFGMGGRVTHQIRRIIGDQLRRF